MSQAKSLVVGASGQVGRRLCATLAARPGAVMPLRSSRSEREGWLQMDLAEVATTADAAALLDGENLEAIYCLGAMTHVDGCESQPELALRANGVGPGALAAYARGRGIPYVFVSTEYVFAGDEAEPGPYAEDDPTRPLSVYGSSKLEGEQRVMAENGDALVLRTTVVYGEDAQAKNYLYGVLRNLATGNAMKVPEDQVSTPTYNDDFARAAVGLVEAKARGVYHVCGPEVMGRLEFAQGIAETFGLDVSLLQGVTTAELGQTAKRPLAAGLSIAKLQREYPELKMRTLAESLADCRPELERYLAEQRAGA